MNIAKLLAAGAVLALPFLASAAQAQVPRGTCMISDPTGTPLNVRSAPAGRIIGNLYNGDFVVMTGTAPDANGRNWAQVTGTSTDIRGWVFREFISCRN